MPHHTAVGLREPTVARVLAVKVAFAEKTPLKLGTTVELRIEPPAAR